MSGTDHKQTHPVATFYNSSDTSPAVNQSQRAVTSSFQPALSNYSYPNDQRFMSNSTTPTSPRLSSIPEGNNFPYDSVRKASLYGSGASNLSPTDPYDVGTQNISRKRSVLSSDNSSYPPHIALNIDLERQSHPYASSFLMKPSASSELLFPGSFSKDRTSSILSVSYFLSLLRDLEHYRYRTDLRDCRQFQWIMYGITSIQIISYIISIIIGIGLADMHENPMFGPSVASFVTAGGLIPLTVRNEFQTQAWRLLVSGFYQSGIITLLVAMYVHSQIGHVVERQWGPWKLGAIYVISLLAGNMAASLIHTTDVVSVAGMSGAIGIIGALFGDSIVNWRALRRPVGQLIHYILLAAIILGLGLAPLNDNIALIVALISGFFVSFLFIPTVCMEFSTNTRHFLTLAGFTYTLAYFGIMVSLLFSNYDLKCGDVCCHFFLTIKC